MFKEISQAEMKGKTVKDVATSTKVAQMVITFEDGTFVAIGINRGHKAGPEVPVLQPLIPKQFGVDLLLHVGVISREEAGSLLTTSTLEPVKNIVAMESGTVTGGGEPK